MITAARFTNTHTHTHTHFPTKLKKKMSFPIQSHLADNTLFDFTIKSWKSLCSNGLCSSVFRLSTESGCGQRKNPKEHG